MVQVFIAFIITSFPDLKWRTDTGVSTELFVGNKKGLIGMTSSGVFFILIFVKFGHVFQIWHRHQDNDTKNLRSFLREKEKRLVSAR